MAQFQRGDIMRKIQIVPLMRMEEMRKYFYEYLTELSGFDKSIKFNDNGTPIYQWFDCYWEDKARYPLYLVVDDQVAGLALVRELGNMQYEIAEFYVCPQFRNNDNAIWFATEITNLFEGQFEFSTTLANTRAVKFWDKFVLSFSGNSSSDDNVWKRWIIRKVDHKSHTLNLNPIYFELIKNKQKILEGRLNDEKRKAFNIGDTITFYKEPEKKETIQAVILDKYIFNNFDQMASKLDKSQLGFEKSTTQEMINVYRTIYLRKDENKYGVVVFKIKTY